MPEEKICSIHGPYDAAYGSCPFCDGERNRPGSPQAAMGAQPRMSFDDDDMPTDIGGGGGGGGGGFDSEGDTEIAGGGVGPAGFSDDVDPTILGEQARDIDVTELEFDDSGAQGILIVKDGMRRGHTYNLSDGHVVGRREGNVILNDPKVSNPHAKFRIEDDKFVIWDFGTKNGTHVNGERITAATELKENDTIKIGDTTFVLKVLI